MFRDDQLTEKQLQALREADDHADSVYMDGPDDYFEEVDRMTRDDRIVTWAERGRHIPLKCKICGAVYMSKNIGYVGARSIFAVSPDADQCDADNHTEADLEPAEELYTGEGWSLALR